ncbi:hypothetical protein [Sphingomonas phage Birtae]|nr:hypothetical protein [Sphingomonas phage Birtae]
MIYAEAAYFDGYHFAHIAAFEEHKRLKRIRDNATKAVRTIERRTGSRARLALVA